MRTEANAPPTDPADAWLSTTAAKDAAAARLHVLHARYGPNHSGGFSLHEAVTARPRDATSIRGLNPVLRELFIGLSDENSPLSKLSADLLYLVRLPWQTRQNATPRTVKGHGERGGHLRSGSYSRRESLGAKQS